MDVTLKQLLDTLLQHIPSGQAWVPYAGVAAVTLFGLVLLFRGARLAPLLAAVVFLGVGGVAGSFAANAFSLPKWPVIGAAGVVAFILGLALFRLWLAALVGVCFAGVGLGAYGLQVLAPHIATYQAQGIDANGENTLQPAGSALLEQASSPEELAKVWTYLSTQVPNFQVSFFAIAAATLLAGFIFGMLLPTASRALFAATTGTFLVGCGLTAGLQSFSPAALTWLQQNGTISWGIVGVTWLGSLLYNIFTCRSKRVVRVVDQSAPAPRPAALT
jgi:hypothetical protein